VIAKNTELSDSTGFLNVHKGTLQHVKYSNIFGIGDCTTLPTPKTAAAFGMETKNFFSFINNYRVRETEESHKNMSA
jgi:sulfide:quinone oxidoreductase